MPDAGTLTGRLLAIASTRDAVSFLLIKPAVLSDIVITDSQFLTEAHVCNDDWL